jgi:hypothetical protein
MVDVLMNRDTGIASLNRYFAWGSELRPWPGELEYLGWAAYGRQNSGSDTRVKSVTDNTYSYARTRR